MDSEKLHKEFRQGPKVAPLNMEDSEMNIQLTTSKAFGFTFALALAGLIAWPQAGIGWGKVGSGQLLSFQGQSTSIMAAEEDKQEEEVDWTLAGKDTRDSTEDETDWTLASRDAKESTEDETDWTLAKGEANDAEEDETDWTLASNDSSEEEEEVDWTLA